jgi:hypothetical protein
LIVGVAAGAVIVVGGAAVAVRIAMSGPSYFASYTTSNYCGLVKASTLKRNVPDSQCQVNGVNGGYVVVFWQGQSAYDNPAANLEIEVNVERNPSHSAAVKSGESLFGIAKRQAARGTDEKITSSRSLSGSWDEGFITDGTDTRSGAEVVGLVVRWANVTAAIYYQAGTFDGGNGPVGQKYLKPMRQSKAETAAESVAADIRASLR